MYPYAMFCRYEGINKARMRLKSMSDIQIATMRWFEEEGEVEWKEKHLEWRRRKREERGLPPSDMY